MGIFGLILGLAVLSILIYKRVPVTYAALAASLTVAVFNLMEP